MSIHSRHKYTDEDDYDRRRHGGKIRHRYDDDYEYSRHSSYDRDRSSSRSSSHSRYRHSSSRKSPLSSGRRSRSRLSRYDDDDDYYCSRSRRHRRSRSRSYSRSHSRSYSRSHSRRSYSRSHSNSYSRRNRSRSRSRHRQSSNSSSSSSSSSPLQENSPGSSKFVNDHSKYDESSRNGNMSSTSQITMPTNNKQQNNSKNEDSELDPTDKEKIHREIEERLRETLAKEGKVYPPRKNEASHPVFANDGSFLEIFKKMQAANALNKNNNSSKLQQQQVQQQQKQQQQQSQLRQQLQQPSNKQPVPVIAKRRGGRILKTGVVAKPTVQNMTASTSKDFWAMYLEEVKQYQNSACDGDGKTRPLLK